MTYISLECGVLVRLDALLDVFVIHIVIVADLTIHVRVVLVFALLELDVDAVRLVDCLV